MNFDMERAFLKRKIPELFGIDIRALAVFRIVLASILLLDLFNRAHNLKAHYTDLGVLPREGLLELANNIWVFSLHMANGTLLYQAILFCVAAVFAFMMLIGYRTRLATIASWVMLLSLQTVNHVVLQGGDVELRVLLFWAMFLPLAKTYSVDAALTYVRAKKEVVLNMATLAVLLQVSFVYMFAPFFKTGVEWHSELSAVWYALSLDQFSTPLGEYMLNFPIILSFFTFFVFWLQRSSFFLLFFPLGTWVVRTVGTSLLIFMHIGFFLHMHIGLFPIISISGLLLFYPKEVWDFLFTRLKTPARKKLTLYYDGECGFCKKSVHLIRMFLLIPETKITQGQTMEAVWSTMQAKDSWVIVDERNKQYTGFQAGVMIAKYSPLLWWLSPLGKLSFVDWFGERVYRLIANHRSRVCLPSEPKPNLPPTLWKKLLFSTTVFIFLAYVIAWNLSTINALPFYMKEAWWAPLFVTRLDQRWNMFAPYPAKEDGWYVIPGKLRNGLEVDLLTGLAVTEAKPNNVSATYKSQRWRKYLTNLWAGDFSQYRVYYGRWICREWNENHEWDDQVLSFDIDFMLEVSGPTGPLPVTKHTTWTHSCF